MFGSRNRDRRVVEALYLRVEQLESAGEPSQRVEMALEKIALTAETLSGLTARFDHLEQDVDLIHDERKDLVIAISEGIERTDRAERRIKNTIRRARKELESRGYTDPGLEAEAYEFRDVDGDGSKNGGLQPLPTAVDPAPQESSIPGVPLETLRSARGI